MDYTQWAHDHKKALAERIIKNSGVVSEDKPVAIFMAGIPGAGKTEFLDRLLADSPTPVLRIDLDVIVTQIKGYTPEKYYAFRGAANPILEMVVDKALHKKLSFALDGTFAHGNGLNNIERALKHGFFVFFIYVYQEPTNAWEITKARELTTRRGVEKNGFVDTCSEVPHRVQDALDKFNGHSDFHAIGVIKDDRYNYTFKRDLVKIDDVAQSTYSKEELTTKLSE